MTKLKYLFTVLYKDGSVFQQNAEDRSIKEPDKRSCFFDVDQEKVAKFILKEQGGILRKGNEYAVDLIDGHFEVNGLPFTMHDNPLMQDFRLIFFRQHQHDLEVGQDKSRELDHRITYIIGWQCTVDGTNYERRMNIK